MPRPAEYRATDHDYRSTDHIEPTADAYTQPAFSLSNRLRRGLWNIVWLLLYRTSPRPLHRWRAMLLRLFGAQLGPDCHFYPASKIWAPWNLRCDDHVAAGDGVELYNPALLTLHSHVILSQGAYLCGATHDDNDPAFPLLAYSMTIERYAWICARAAVLPGVHIGEGAVLGLGAVANRNLEPWTVYAGNPAQPIRPRNRTIT